MAFAASNGVIYFLSSVDGTRIGLGIDGSETWFGVGIGIGTGAGTVGVIGGLTVSGSGITGIFLSIKSPLLQVMQIGIRNIIFKIVPCKVCIYFRINIGRNGLIGFTL